MCQKSLECTWACTLIHLHLNKLKRRATVPFLMIKVQVGRASESEGSCNTRELWDFGSGDVLTVLWAKYFSQRLSLHRMLGMLSRDG